MPEEGRVEGRLWGWGPGYVAERELCVAGLGLTGTSHACLHPLTQQIFSAYWDEALELR